MQSPVPVIDPAPPVPRTFDDGELLQIKGTPAVAAPDAIDVEDFGARADDAASAVALANREAFADAIEAAVRAGTDVTIPAGTFYLGFTRHAPSIPIRGDVRILGQGRSLSRLVPDAWKDHGVVGASPTFAYDVFSIEMQVPEVGLQGFSIEPTSQGPYGAVWDGAHSVRDNPTSNGIRVAPQFHPGGRVTIRDYLTNHEISRGVYVQSGASTQGCRLVLVDCDLSGALSCAAYFGGPQMVGGEFFAFDVIARRGGTLDRAKGVATEYFGHCFYLHPHVAFTIVDTTFLDSTGGQTGTNGRSINHRSDTVDTAPPYASLLLRCTFTDKAGGVVLTDHGDVRAEKIRMDSLFTGIISRKRTDVHASTFLGNAALTQSGDELFLVADSVLRGRGVIGSVRGTGQLAFLRCVLDKTRVLDGERLENSFVDTAGRVALERCTSTATEVVTGKQRFPNAHFVVRTGGELLLDRHTFGGFAFRAYIQPESAQVTIRTAHTTWLRDDIPHVWTASGFRYAPEKAQPVR